MTFGRAREVLFPEGADDALIEQRLQMLRIDRERLVELRERAVRLVRVVVGHAEIGAGVDVLRIELERGFIPRESPGRTARRRSTGCRARRGRARWRAARWPAAQVGRLRGIERRRRRGRSGRGAGRRRSAAGAAGGGRRGRLLVPMIQPTSTPKNVAGQARTPGSHVSYGSDLRDRSYRRARRRSGRRPSSTARYSRTTRSRPTHSARLIRAWPIDTSSRCGRVRNSRRFPRSRSCPALTPSPSVVRQPRRPPCSAASCSAPSASPRANAAANGSV